MIRVFFVELLVPFDGWLAKLLVLLGGQSIEMLPVRYPTAANQ